MARFKKAKMQIQYLKAVPEGGKQTYAYGNYSKLKEAAADADILKVAQSLIALQTLTSGEVKKMVETVLN